MRIIICLLILSCSACGSDTSVESKREYWSSVADTLNTQRPTRASVLESYKQYVVPAGSIENEIVLLDKLELNNMACKSWSYIINIHFEESGELKKARMTDAGTCL